MTFENAWDSEHPVDRIVLLCVQKIESKTPLTDCELKPLLQTLKTSVPVLSNYRFHVQLFISKLRTFIQNLQSSAQAPQSKLAKVLKRGGKNKQISTAKVKFIRQRSTSGNARTGGVWSALRLLQTQLIAFEYHLNQIEKGYIDALVADVYPRSPPSRYGEAMVSPLQNKLEQLMTDIAARRQQLALLELDQQSTENLNKLQGLDQKFEAKITGESTKENKSTKRIETNVLSPSKKCHNLQSNVQVKRVQSSTMI